MDNLKEMNIAGPDRGDFLSVGFKSRDGTRQIIDIGREWALFKDRSCEETVTMNKSVESR